jgi:hypothetical protein
VKECWQTCRIIITKIKTFLTKLSVRPKLDYVRPIEPIMLVTTVKIVRALFDGSKVGFTNAVREFLI